MQPAFFLVEAGPAARSRVLAVGDGPGAGPAADRGVPLRAQRMLGQGPVLGVAGHVGFGPGRDRVDLDHAAPDVVADHGGPHPGGGLVAAQPGHPGGAPGKRLGHRDDLAGHAAAVGVVHPPVVGLDLGLDDPQVQVVAAPDRVDEPQRLGEVVLGVEEDHLDVGDDLGGEVEEHAVLERRGEDEPVAEPVGGPLDRRGGRLAFEAVRRRGEFAQVGQVAVVGRSAGHVAHSLSPTSLT